MYIYPKLTDLLRQGILPTEARRMLQTGEIETRSRVFGERLINALYQGRFLKSADAVSNAVVRYEGDTAIYRVAFVIKSRERLVAAMNFAQGFLAACNS